MASISLPIIHFNDVYNMTRPRDGKLGNKKGEILIDTDDMFDHLTQFAAKVDQLRDRWPLNTRGEPEGLLLFSGDLFSPSVESMLTKGRNMVHLMNELSPDACVPGNHEFDFGVPRFKQLVEFCNFNWTLGNLKESKIEPKVEPKNNQEGPVDTKTQAKLVNFPGVHEYLVFNLEHAGLRVGVIGVMSPHAYNSVGGWGTDRPELLSMVDTCLKLSKQLRQPNKDEKPCDIVIALTHAGYEEDVDLAIALGAYSLDTNPDVANLEGVDAIFGGHDHEYFLGKGANVMLSSYKGPEKAPLFSKDNGLLIVKSGMDFFDLSEVVLDVVDTPNGSVRKKVIKSLQVFRHHINPVAQGGGRRMKRVLTNQYQNEILRNLKIPLAYVQKGYYVNEEDMRRKETALGNWVADALCSQVNTGQGGAPPFDGFFMTGGSIRGKMTLHGQVTQHQVIRLLPFESGLRIVEMKGSDVRRTFELALRDSGAQAGEPIPSSAYFPVVSRFKVEWDSAKRENERVESIKIMDSEGKETELEEEKVYKILTNSFLAAGNDGFVTFKTANKLPYEGLPMYQVLKEHLGKLQLEKTNDQLKKKIQQEEEKEKAQIQALNEVEQQIDQGNFFGTIFSGLKAIGLALFNLEIEEGDYLPVIVFDQELGRVKNKAEQPHSQ